MNKAKEYITTLSEELKGELAIEDNIELLEAVRVRFEREQIQWEEARHSVYEEHNRFDIPIAEFNELYYEELKHWINDVKTTIDKVVEAL